MLRNTPQLIALTAFEGSHRRQAEDSTPGNKNYPAFQFQQIIYLLKFESHRSSGGKDRPKLDPFRNPDERRRAKA
jgi:hypothetical protein